MSEMDLTIAICAFNSTRPLPLALEALRDQQVPAGTTWELLVIDNRSTDGTGALAERLGREWSLPMRVIVENEPGLIHARRRAAAEARGTLLSFIDDDNLVDPDWIARCLEFFAAHPACGVVGGKIDPRFEDPASRPADFNERYADALAIRDLGASAMQLVPPRQDPPCGAGMTGRTALFRDILLRVGCQLSGRKGKALTAGEDTEIGLIAHRLGWELWYSPALHMQHLLPSWRLSEAYLDKLIAGGARSEAWLNVLRGREPRRSRLGYLVRATSMGLVSAKMWLLAILRRGERERFRFWARLYRNRAAGCRELAMAYPFERLESLVKQAAPPAPAAAGVAAAPAAM